MRINTNLSALNAYRNLNMTDNRLNKSLERLSSGLRINRAADDAAGLAISEKMRGQIRGLNQATRNAQDGISLMQTAEGALNETHSILQRMRELAVQAASDTLTSSDRIEIQREIEQLRNEIDRIASSTEFNTKKLLDGSSAALTSTSDLNTKVFMRGGLRTVDQFGQKAVGGGNYELSIDATAGQGEVQKTDIMKVKHGVEQETVEKDSPGHAKAAFTGIDDLSGAATLNFRVDGKIYQVEFEAGDFASGDDTSQLAGLVNNELGHIFTAYGEGDEVGWRDTVLTAGDTVFALDGTGFEGKSFDFWVDNDDDNPIDISAADSFPESETTYVPTQEFITGVTVDNPENLFQGDYTVDMGLLNDTVGSAGGTDIQRYNQEDLNGIDSFTVVTGQDTNISLLLEVTEVGSASVTVEYNYHVLTAEGNYVSESGGTRTLESGTNTYNFGDVEVGMEISAVTSFTEGDKYVMSGWNVDQANDRQQVTINRDGDEAVQYTFDPASLSAVESLDIKFYQLDEGTGETKNSTINLEFHENAWETNGGLLQFEADQEVTVEDAAFFTVGMSEGIGNVASRNTAIKDIDRFWDANGNFLVQDPQTINLVAGDGKSTSITIFGSDTIADIEQKLNNAIHEGLNQKDFNDDDNKYAQFVDGNNVAEEGNFTVKGTFVIQSAVTGNDGEIRFSGNEGIINALSLTTLQESEENEFTVTVKDAHDGEVIAEDERIVGNMLVGVVHENVDVKFDPMAGIRATVNDNGQFEWEGSSDDDSDIPTSKIFVHLSDNTMVFHIGANPLQDVGAAIGDMSSEALGIDNMLLTNRESANRALSQIDYAIANVSSERAKLGAVQNRLEHTINNLTVASENLSAAESRVRDLDFALEMVEFTRNQIMTQAGTSMLAQANQKPQSVLMLLQ